MGRFWPKSLHRGVWTLAVAAFAAVTVFPVALRAQWPVAQPQGAPQNTLPAATQPRLTPDQLDNLVAPIALYPDPLLSQVLVASTYPLEVVEAQQWLKQNSSLGGQQLMAAAQQQNWDASVQALVAFPDVLDTLTQDVQWTTALGNAFLAQQQDVMAAVQRMRAQAQANGRLASNSEQTVTTAYQDGGSAIEIQPANPEVIYVPQYDPMYIWGPPAWGYYPSLYYPAFGYGFWPGINIGLCFGGWGGGGWGWGGWGWSPGWFGGNVFVNFGFFNHYGFRRGFGGRFGGGGRGIWAHNPEHRLGVAYPNRGLTSRYGAASRASRANSLNGLRYSGSGMRNSFGQPMGGANRGGFAGGAAGRQYGYGAGGRSTAPGAQNFRGGAQGPARAYNAPSYGRSQGFAGGGYRGFSGSSPSFRGSAPSYGGGYRGFSGGAARGFSGGAGGGYRGFSGSSPSFRGSAPSYSGGYRGFSGGAARSFSGGGSGGYRGFSGGGSRSFGGGGGGFHGFSGGGGGGRSFGGGGGGHSFGGGGGHFGGGGGHSGGHR